MAFPIWLLVCHALNILFMTLLARSGVEVLSAFPKLYVRDSCVPGTELVRFSSKRFATADHPTWQSLDEEVSWSPMIALPGRRSLGLGRHWHFLTLEFWILTGLVYVALLFASGDWPRLVPTNWSIVPQAFQAIGGYLHGQLVEPKNGHPYNAAQQLAYFGVVFVLAPLQILTGAAMSPAIIGRFPRYPRLFGGRQCARTLHFCGLCAFGAFIVIHTTMVVVHGIPREFAAIVLGSYHANHLLAVAIGLAAIAATIGFNAAATIFSTRRPRLAQRLLGLLVDPVERVLVSRLDSRQRYQPRDVSPFFRVNGHPPVGDDYWRLADGGFGDYRLAVGGLVARPLVLSLDELRGLGATMQTTMHNCIQGWTALAEWAGVPLATLLDRCDPLPQARYIVFHAFDDKAETEGEPFSGCYYGTLPIHLARHPQTLLALEMNGKPLAIEHGSPVRLRVETQLGFKHVKWIRAIELVEDYRTIGEGQGGWREDQQHYTTFAGI